MLNKEDSEQDSDSVVQAYRRHAKYWRFYPICKQCGNILIITPSTDLDTDECAQNNGGCSDQAVCSNTKGSFLCSCNDGFAGDGLTCTGMPSTCELLTVLPICTTVLYC